MRGRTTGYLSPEERRKIGELIKAKGNQQLQSKNANEPDPSTSWMYEQPKGNAEDFLLGKAIRSLEELTEINRDQEEETPAQRLTRLDMEAKFREDPLNLMRQHEMDKRSALLQNTARMKKLQHLIELQNHAKEKAEKRKEAKKKEDKGKKKRRRISSSSSDSSENPEDDIILEKFISLIRNPDGGKDKAQNSGKGEEKKKKEKKKKHRHTHHSKKNKVKSPVKKFQNPSSEVPLIRSGDRSQRRSKSTSRTKALEDRTDDWDSRQPTSKSSRSPCSNQHSKKSSYVGSLYRTDCRIRRRSSSRSQRKACEGRTDDRSQRRFICKSSLSTRRKFSEDSPRCCADRNRCKFRSGSRNNSPKSHLFRIDDRTHRRPRSRSSDNPPRQHRSPLSYSNLHRRHKRSSRSRSFEQSHRGGGRRRTQEEMAALRAQMAADAKEREVERRQRFEKHQMETAREEKVEGEARTKHGASFLRGLTLDHVTSTSVEEVVQRNVKSRQRGGMDENFLRK
ncbi:unnamed protein product [Taenia asiatica]|uniref:Pre-mRNA-splicing factor CWC25 homolog n=1 Tax=Taenia asiatica TaxID=60517 RepID=A0A0R3WAI4_TAEAS|nr:unnamed protein product [Taenia asiatica]